MSTYSHVDTIQYPSLINITGVNEPTYSQDPTESLQSLPDISLPQPIIRTNSNNIFPPGIPISANISKSQPSNPGSTTYVVQPSNIGYIPVIYQPLSGQPIQSSIPQQQIQPLSSQSIQPLSSQSIQPLVRSTTMPLYGQSVQPLSSQSIQPLVRSTTIPLPAPKNINQPLVNTQQQPINISRVVNMPQPLNIQPSISQPSIPQQQIQPQIITIPQPSIAQPSIPQPQIQQQMSTISQQQIRPQIITIPQPPIPQPQIITIPQQQIQPQIIAIPQLSIPQQQIQPQIITIPQPSIPQQQIQPQIITIPQPSIPQQQIQPQIITISQPTPQQRSIAPQIITIPQQGFQNLNQANTQPVNIYDSPSNIPIESLMFSPSVESNQSGGSVVLLSPSPQSTQSIIYNPSPRSSPRSSSTSSPTSSSSISPGSSPISSAPKIGEQLEVVNIELISPRQSKQSREVKASNQFPVKNIPAFAPPKYIDVNNALDINNDTKLRDQLKSNDIEIRGRAVKALEYKIITKQGHCPNDIVESLRVGTFQLNPQMMSSYLNSDGIFDHNYQDGVGCLVDAMISEEDIIPDARMRRWITNITRIGDASAEGKAFRLSNIASSNTMSSNIKSSNITSPQSPLSPLFVIKVSNDPNDDTLPHEALVGMGALNTLRNQIPNFVHTYGAFLCAPPIMAGSRSVAAWCPAKAVNITYLVIENIGDAVTLHDLAWDMSEDVFLQIYLQIMNALNEAYKKFDYTHYDLHTKNVLVQKLNYYVSIPFYHPNKTTMYIRTKYVARIIDYGMSHIYLQGQHFGAYDYDPVGINPEKSFPMYDAYKLLLFTYFNSTHRLDATREKYTNKLISLITKVASYIYDFFDEGITLAQRISRGPGVPVRYIDPKSGRQVIKQDFFQPDQDLMKYNFDDLINYILKEYNPTFLTPSQSSDSISTVCGDKCVDWNGFTKNTFDRTALPSTLEDYCQSNTTIDKLSNGNRHELKKWIQQFDIGIAYNSEKNEVINKLNNVINDINKFNLDIITDSDFNFEIYTEQLENLIRIRSQLQEIKLWVASANCSFNMNGRLNEIQDDIGIMNIGISNVDNRIKEFVEIIKYNITKDEPYEDLSTVPNIITYQKILMS